MKACITVVGAAIVKDGKILALRRADGNDEVVHKFEFVGGKVEDGETPEQALKRECREELSLEIEVGGLLNTIEYDYPNTTVRLSVYFVKPLSGYELKVHEEERWFDCSAIDASEWAPADKMFLGILKKGIVSAATAKTEEEFRVLGEIAADVMHETYDDSLPWGQVSYMLENFLSPEAVSKSIEKENYVYKLVYLNGEAVGFYAYCPAKFYNPEYAQGTYLSKLYLKKFARGKRIAAQAVSNLARPVYLTVKRDNLNAVNVYKHFGFKILKPVKADIGCGFFTDDYLMQLQK